MIKSKYITQYKAIITALRILAMAILAMAPAGAYALSLDTYATESKLATGKWVKISVPESGLYKITDAQLRQWGFADPSKVKVYGYGGDRIPSELSRANYIDDLPMVQTIAVTNGLVFYGVGPESWTVSQNPIYVNMPNIYTSEGYYFLSDIEGETRPIDKQGLAVEPESSASKFFDRVHYEYDRTSPGEAGYLLVGESFKSQASRKVSFDAMASGKVLMECGIVSNSSFASTVSFSVNGKEIATNTSDKIATTAVSGYLHGTYNVAYHEFELEASKIDVTVTVANASSMRNCWLDYLTLNLERDMALPSSGYLKFWASNPSNTLSASAAVRVLDVTNPQEITELNLGSSASAVAWTNDYTGDRAYVAFAENASLPTPSLVGTVANQNIHAMEVPDMVIFTHPEYMAQAERIAALHRNAAQPLAVHVLNVATVYNEFGSGAADVSALRKCMKMFYDRGNSADSVADFRYALLLGCVTYDNRHLTSQFDSDSYPTIPGYMGGERRSQLSDNSAFGTDDFVAMLEDGSGTNLGLDLLSVCVGRIPVRTADQAKSAVDKLTQYVQKAKTGTWRNSFLFLADDGNDGVHVEQTEKMIRNLLDNDLSQAFVSKVYVDAYDIVAGSCEGGRQDMYRMLNEGVLWWNFAGHANNHSWTAENMLNFNDINNLYLSKVPILMAATCDFLRWDSNTVSGGEILYHERYGGNIATISATRPVYITDNGYFTAAMGKAVTQRLENGRMPRIGEIYRNAKNGITNSLGDRISNSNRLRFVLMGDPAMELVMADNIVTLDSIGDEPVNPDSQVTLMALQQTVLKGSVRNPQGEVLTDFNGIVEANIYDAERSITTKGVREENVKITFEQHGDKLFSGSAQVVNGYFQLKVAMPGEVADNFRPATINMAASATDGSASAVGVNRDFYVYGLDESSPADTSAPVIEAVALNHTSFKNGDIVNESPMVLATIRDDIGINLSSAGVGHQMTLTLDGTRAYNDVTLYFTPSADGTPSGTIAYPLESLTDGAHTLRLRVWDTSGNSASQEIEFTVQAGLQPTIYDIYCDANPARTETNFYISHDRPDGELSVKVGVYSLLGRPIWETTVKGRSDMFLSTPVNWNLCDNSGKRVPRGIYLYRASISSDNGETYSTGSRKLAVTAP